MTSLLPPPVVPPVEANGIRYQQDNETDFTGRDDLATYLSAIDIKTNTILWVIKICDCLRYPRWPAPGGPPEIMTIDFRKMTLGPDENQLTIETEVDSRYLVDLKTKAVTLIPEPQPIKKRRKIREPDPSDPPMPPPWPRGKKG